MIGGIIIERTTATTSVIITIFLMFFFNFFFIRYSPFCRKREFNSKYVFFIEVKANMSISMGEQLMKTLLGGPISSHYIDNYKPSWLNGLELDRYYPPLRMAFEFQGEQHIEFSFSKHNSHEDFIGQWNRDQLKKSILQKKKIILVEYSASELSIPTFSQKLSEVLLEPVIINNEKLEKDISRYQSGLQIHFKRELKNLLVSSSYYDFVRIPKIDDAINRFLTFSNINLSSGEKRCLCILTLLARDNQVLLNRDQLLEYFPKLQLDCYLETLLSKNMLFFNSDFGLISIKNDVFLKCYRFVHSLLSYINDRKKGTGLS